MSNIPYLPLLTLAIAVGTAGMPFVPPVQLTMGLVPAAIIEGGTVSTLPKSVKTRNGKVVVLHARADRVKPAKPPAAVPSRARTRQGDVVREQPVAGAGGSSVDVVELRQTENGLRVMIIGPDGLTRTRYVPSAPGATARHNQDD